MALNLLKVLFTVLGVSHHCGNRVHADFSVLSIIIQAAFYIRVCVCVCAYVCEINSVNI